MARKPAKWDRSWVRTAADALAVERGCYFDLKAAKRVRDFFRTFLRHSKGVFSGQPFELQPWQWSDVVAPLFGWKRADGSRRYRRAYIEIPKKNGKSALCSGISLYLLVGDGEAGAVVANAACDRSQAGIVFDEAAEMVRSSPDLAGALEVIDSRKTIVDRAHGGRYYAMSADVPQKEGLNISGLVTDELHAQRSREMSDTLLHAGAARRQPLSVTITTAGVYDPGSIGWETHEYARQVLDGTIEDDAFFAYIKAAPADADWTDPATWRAANPSIGVTVHEGELAEQCKAAQFSVALQNVFRRYRLNQWTSQASRWIDLALWDANDVHPIAPDTLPRKCWGGLDVAAVSDLTAEVLLFPCQSDPAALDVLARFWLPENVLRESKHRALYQQWLSGGWLTLTPGDVVDYAFVQAQVVADAARYGLVDLAIDRLFQGQQLATDLQDEEIAVFPFGQGFLSFAAPMVEFQRRLEAKRLHHGANPILRWMADHVVVRTDPAGNLKPDRQRSSEKIDGVVALVMALDRAIRQPAVVQSVYMTHGVMGLEEYL